MDDILGVEGLTKTFGGLVALSNIGISVKKGLMTMLIGPNGSGKTTLVNCITGFYTPDRGRVHFDGKEITGWPPHRVYEAGLVRTFQIPQPFQKLTVLENLLTAYRGNPGESFLKAPIKRSWLGEEEKATAMAFRFLDLLDLTHMWDKPATNLSGGQMKLVEAGRAIMSGAKMILMDEPAAGIYPKLAQEVFYYFTEMKTKLGVTFLVIEHRLELILRYVDHVYAMARGRLVSEGDPKTVLDDPVVIESYLGG
ncbi:MAG: ABC transporter ATP-binding protein [Candidatus Bathyarchaeota archaeon]|nr:ABC transporter ATP-binding protein [Candidatus Bathyarchaeota archaeon]